MTARLTSDMLVGALIRRVQAEGGHATVLAKGDPGAGAVIVACTERGRTSALLERALTAEGGYGWVRCGPDGRADEVAYTDYIARRRGRDPDLWVVELDIAGAERFAAETSGVG